MNSEHFAALSAASLSLFQVSADAFWLTLPVALLLALLMIYVSGEISGSRLESLFRRLLIAIALLVAFPQISSAIQGLEEHLIDAFGGDTSLTQVFAKVGDKAKEMKEQGTSNWLKIGQFTLSLITTLSFLILSIVKRFLDVLHLTIWNLLHILGPLALLGCLFPSFSAVPKGVFMGMLELALWKPVWVILARLLIAIGFGETSADPSQWFDIAVMNFAVAGLMACTPMLVHGFLSGSLATAGGSAIQTMLSGAGVAMASAPMKAIQTGGRWAKESVSSAARGPLSNISFKNHSDPQRPHWKASRDSKKG